MMQSGRSGAKARLVLIVESPFSARDEERFGVRILQERGITVDVWEVGSISLPRSELQWTNPSRYVTPTECNDIPTFHALTSHLMSGDSVVVLFGIDGRGQSHAETMYSKLSESPAKLTTITLGHLPALKTGARIRLQADYFRRQHGGVSQLFRHRAKIRQGILRLGRRGHGTGNLGDACLPLRPYDRVWGGTEIGDVHPALIGEETSVEFVHTLDYDQILDLHPCAAREGAICVFLDAMGPMHPDYLTLDLRYELTMAEYSRRVCTYLDKVEAAQSLRTVIAAHPRAQPGVLEPWYGGREIAYGQTAALLATSRHVVAAGASTSIALAVALERPISLVMDVPRITEDQVYLEAYIRELGLGKLSTGAPTSRWTIPEPDLVKYRSFVARYVKRPGTPMKPFWEVVADGILGESDCAA